MGEYCVKDVIKVIVGVCSNLTPREASLEEEMRLHKSILSKLNGYFGNDLNKVNVLIHSNSFWEYVLRGNFANIICSCDSHDKRIKIRHRELMSNKVVSLYDGAL